MKFKLVFYFSLLFLACSCGSGDENKTIEMQFPLSDSAKVEEAQVVFASDLEAFRNMEIVEYCVLLPIKEYVEKTGENEKAAHAFAHKTKMSNEISIHGLLRANTEVSIENYFAGSLEDAELEGKVIEEKALIKTNNCFYAKGYWANSIYESRFIEVCWLRSDDVVKYYSFFDIADTTLWNNRLKEILNSGSMCK